MTCHYRPVLLSCTVRFGIQADRCNDVFTRMGSCSIDLFCKERIAAQEPESEQVVSLP